VTTKKNDANWPYPICDSSFSSYWIRETQITKLQITPENKHALLAHGFHLRLFDPLPELKGTAIPQAPRYLTRCGRGGGALPCFGGATSAKVS